MFFFNVPTHQPVYECSFQLRKQALLLRHHQTAAKATESKGAPSLPWLRPNVETWWQQQSQQSSS